MILNTVVIRTAIGVFFYGTDVTIFILEIVLNSDPNEPKTKSRITAELHSSQLIKLTVKCQIRFLLDEKSAI